MIFCLEDVAAADVDVAEDAQGPDEAAVPNDADNREGEEIEQGQATDDAENPGRDEVVENVRQEHEILQAAVADESDEEHNSKYKKIDRN